MSLTPPIGSSGLFTLSGPFASSLQSQVSYTCDAVRRMADIIKLGIDPHREYYAPKGLTIEQYQTDLQNNESIVSLRSNSGHWVYVPTSYISSYPNAGGIPYTALVLGINIGAIPTYLDLTQVKQRIVDVVRDTLGVNSSVVHAAISPTKNLPQADHNATETARLSNINNSGTDRAQYLNMKAQRDAALQRIAELEQYIRDNLAP